MTIERLRGKFAGSVCSLGLLGALIGCSGSEAGPGGATAGSGGSAGSDASGGSAGSSASGGGSAGSSGTPGGGNGGGSAIPDALVGAFQVELSMAEEPGSWRTSVIGKVNDGITPQSIVWDTKTREGECWLEKPRAPFCSDGCGADVCVEDDVCLAYPEAHSVGEVKLSGVHATDGSTELVLKEIAKAYQPAAGVTFADPPFAEGDAVELTASGGDYSAFELEAVGIAPLEVTSTDFELAEGKGLDLTWTAASKPDQSVVHLKLDISHHGGSRGLIECDAADDGSLSVSASLISELIALGYAGFPSLVLTRTTRDSVQLPPGRVELVVSAKVEQAVTIEGVTSCSGDPQPGDPPECPEGTTCQDDLTCR